jgi:hypothetical protein
MRTRPFVTVAVLVALALTTALAPLPTFARDEADKQLGNVEKGEQLLEEGDRLADEGKYDQAVLKYKEAFEQLLPRMRRLPFKREVKGNVTTRDQLKDMLVKMVDEEIPPEEMRGDELALKALGLIPQEMDLKQTMLAMLTEEIAGFYDPRTGAMHLIIEAAEKDPKKEGRKPGLLDRLFGGGGKKAFDKEENKTILAHEMTHALADQHYDLDAMQEAVKDDGDREIALTALVEGEAMLTMMGAAAEDWDGDTTASIPANRLALMMNMLGPMLTFSTGKTFREAPPILSESLIFPYLKGLVFSAHLTNQGGWGALDAAYKNPPLSTEQVLHPEKYLGKRGRGGKLEVIDVPMAIDLGELEPGGGWKEADRDVVGEMALGIMLRDVAKDARAAAAGWDGDTYAAFEQDGGKRLALVWASTWDTEKDAREFAAAYAKFQAKKFALDAKNDAPPADDFKAPLRREKDGKSLVIEVRGADAAVIEGFDAATTDRLLKAAFETRKTEKTHAARADPEQKAGPEQQKGKESQQDDGQRD